MGGMFSKLYKTLGIYTFSNILNSSIPFLLLPFLTKMLTPSDYAIVDLFQAAAQFAIAVVGLNTASALSRFYFDNKEREFSNYVGNSLIILIVSGVVVMSIVFVFKSNIEDLIKIPQNWLWLIVIYALSLNVIQTLLSIWQVEYKAVSYGIFRIIRTLLDVSLSIVFIYIYKYNWKGRVLGQTIAVSVFALLAMIILLKNRKVIFKINYSKIKKLLSFGSPLILHILGAVIITYSDRIFIANYVSLDSVGTYAVGYQVGMIVYLIETSFNQAWVPWLFEKLKENVIIEKLKIVKFTYIYFIGIFLFAVIIALIAPFIYKLFVAKTYNAGIKIVIWIATGFAFNGMYKMVVNYIFYIKKTYIISIITIFTAMVNVSLNYFLVNRYGAIGVAQATTISFFIQFVIVWIISSRLYKMPWNLNIKI